MAGYKILRKYSEILELIGFCKQTGYCSFDFETSNLEFYEKHTYITIISISFQPGSRYIIPLGHFESPFKSNYLWILEKLGEELFENKDIIKVCWNIKFEQSWLLSYGIKLKGYCIDGMLAKYTLRETRPSDLKSMVAEFYPEYADYEGKLEVYKRKYGWAGIPLETLAEYGGIDADLTLRLALRFEKKIMELGFYPLFRNLLTPLNYPLGHCEFNGIPIDTKYLDDLVTEFAQLINEKEQYIYNIPAVKKYNKKKHYAVFKQLIASVKEEIAEIEKEAEDGDERVQASCARKIANRNQKIQAYIKGEATNNKDKEKLAPLNLGSGKQMIDFLFESKYGLRLEIIKYTKNKKTNKESNTPSVDEDTLIQLKEFDSSGFMDALLDLRSLTKLNSTNVVGVKERISSEGNIHTKFKIHGTVTGRLSSADPNLQNIPRVTTDARIKGMYKAPPGYVILELDYSQAELRVVAELAKEPDMIEWFSTGRNIHVAVACKAENADYDIVYPITKDKNHPEYDYWTRRKKRAKTINFGILYGQEPKKLAETLNNDLQPGQKKYTVKEAAKFRDDWFKLFPRVKAWISKQHKFAEKNGYVKTPFGRKRRLPEIYSDIYGKYLEAQRQSVNAPIQSIASDFTQFSSILIHIQRLEGKLPICLKQIYTVHDSIGFLIKPEYIHEVVPKLIEICYDPETNKWFHFKMKYVKMKVSIEIGKRWNEIEDYDQSRDYSLLIQGDTII
jgi:DNA polymerase I-like protein with 3'-5' exonuclease and polymerase domains